MGLFGPPNVDRMAARRNVSGLVKALGYRKAWNIRQSAANALGGIADPRAIPALIGALQDEDKDVRRAAADSLHQLGWQPAPDASGIQYRIIRKEWRECAAVGEPAVEPLIAVLLGEEWADSRAAADAVGAIGDTRAVTPLFTALKKYGWGIIGTDVAEALSRIGAPAVPPLMDRLAEGDADARLAAVTALGAIGDPRSVQPLFFTLRGPDLHVCESAARALARIGAPAVEQLILALTDSDVPWEAARALGEIADARAVEPLINAFSQPNWMVRDAAVAALGRIGAPAIAPLLSALQNPDREIRRCAAEALDRLEWRPRHDEAGAYYWIAKNQWMNCVEIGAPAVDPLIIVLSDSQAEVRRAAAATLGILGDAAAQDPLLISLEDPDGLVVAAAAEALGCLRSRAALEPLLHTLQNPHWQARAAAAESLGRIGLPAAVEPLLAALTDTSSHVREAVVGALGHLGDRRAVEPLIEALGHGDEDVHRAAAESLGKLGDPRAVPVLLMVLDWEYYIVREAAAVQQAMRDTRSRNYLMEELKEKHILIRTAAARALGEIGDPSALEPLMQALRYVSGGVREAAAAALGMIGDAQAVDSLVAALRDKDPNVRNAAIESLVRLDSAAVGPALEELRDESPEIRGMAAEILGKIGSVRGVDPLIDAFLDSDRTVRRATATALVRIGLPGVDSLIQALKIEDEEVRTLAAEVLGKLNWQPGRDEAAAYYRIAKFQWDQCVEIGGPAVLPLINAFHAPREESRRAAIASLSRIGAPAVDALIETLRDETEKVFPAAVETLGNIGAPAVPALLVALRDEHFVVCKGAAEALGIIGDPRAVEPLMRTLRTGVWYVIRKAAADALGRISDARAVDPLVAALGDEYFKVRDSAQDALLRIGKPAVPALNAALAHREWRVRKAAAETLGKIGDPRSIEPLIPVLDDDDKDVRKAAAWALVPFSHSKLLEDAVKQKILSVMA